MGADPENTRLHDRIEKSQEAIARFARMTEEYRAIRQAILPGPARDRIDGLIQLNEDTAAILKRGLVLTEGDLGRSEKSRPEQRV